MGGKNTGGLTQDMEAAFQNPDRKSPKVAPPPKITRHAIPLFQALSRKKKIKHPHMIPHSHIFADSPRKNSSRGHIMPIPQNLGNLRIEKSQAISQTPRRISTSS